MKSGKAAVRDVWMMSRLNDGVSKVNNYFEKYEFGLAQQNAYSLWISDICDVYLEVIKPVVYDMSPENAGARWASQATLWHR